VTKIGHPAAGRQARLSSGGEAGISDGRRNVPGSRAAGDEAAAPGDMTRDADLRERQEALLDEAVEETFPASDPISVAVPCRRTDG
jgi:hypothetical protein